MHHLWYSSEALVGLAFLDSEVNDTEKRKMIHALSKLSENPPTPRVASLDDRTVYELTLSNFFSTHTHKFLEAMQIETDFLQ